LCDINVLVELEKPLGWDFFALKEFLQRKLEIHIDIITANAIKPAMQADVMKEVHFI
jgi:predicted nucleotidyltransferase